MVEPEIPYADLDELCDTAEQLVKHCVKNAMSNDASDLEQLLSEKKDTQALLSTCVENDFARITYSEAIQVRILHSLHFVTV